MNFDTTQPLTGDDQINQWMNHPAYWDANHPQHHVVKAAVEEFFGSAGQQPHTRRPSAVILDSSTGQLGRQE
jgi:hypothetical protein